MPRINEDVEEFLNEGELGYDLPPYKEVLDYEESQSKSYRDALSGSPESI